MTLNTIQGTCRGTGFAGPVAGQFSEEEVSAGRLRVVEEVMASGGYELDLGRIEANFAEWPNARLVQGVVPEVLGELAVERVAFLHLDMNCAYPEVSALRFFWERMPRGGVVLLDDYAYFGNGELKGAIDAAAAGLGASVLGLPTGQGLIVR